MGLRATIVSGGTSGSITGLITNGTGIAITGGGTMASPYVITNTGSGGGGSSATAFATTVSNFAALPAASGFTGQVALVLTSTGAFGSRKLAGTYYSDGTNWNFESGIPSDDYTNLNTDTGQVIIGRYSATAGAFQELTLGAGLSLNSSTGVLNTVNNGTVTSVAATGNNGVSISGSPITGSGTITIGLGAITPTSVNGITLSGSGTPSLIVTGSSSISGNNTGDQTITLTSDVTGSGTGSFATTIKSSVNLTGNPTTTTQTQGDNSTKIATTAYVDTGLVTKQATGNYITALTGDGTASGPGSVAFTLATVNTNTGSFGSSTSIPNFTVNGKGLITAAGSNVVIAPAGTLTGTTLASNVVISSLTSVGTLATLTVTATINGSITGNAATVTTNANLTGDVTSVGNATTLATVNSNIGTFGDASHVAQVTENGKGLTTAVSSVPIQIAESQVTNLTTDLAGKQTTVSLTTTGTSGASTFNATTGALNIPNYATGGGSTVNNYINTLQIDQTPASGSYGTLAGAVNGTNAVFTVSNSAYVTGSLMPFLNGQEQTQGSAYDWVETSPGSGTFTFNVPPPTGSILQAAYIKTSSAALTSPIRVVTASGAITVTNADSTIIVNKATGAATAVGFASIPATGQTFTVTDGKGDAATNNITITPFTGLINGASTYVITTNRAAVQFQFDGTNSWVI